MQDDMNTVQPIILLFIRRFLYYCHLILYHYAIFHLRYIVDRALEFCLLGDYVEHTVGKILY